MQDETMRLILELGGQAAVKQMADSVSELEAKIKALALEWTHGGIATDAYLAESKTLEGQLEQTKGALGQLQGKGGVSGNGLLGISFAVQDFTSQLGTRGLTGALGAVQNNIPQILVGLGAGPGLAGVISVISVGLGMMLPQIEKLAEYFGTGATKTEVDRMKELGDNTKRTAEETKTLNKYKKEQAEAEKILNSETKAKQEEQGGFEELLAGDGEAVQRGIAKGLAASGRGFQMDEAEKKRLAMLNEQVVLAVHDNDKAKAQQNVDIAKVEIQKRIDEANMGTAKGMLGRIPTDKNTRAQVGAMARGRPQDFPHNFANDMAGMEPEALAAYDKDAQAFDNVNDEWILGQPRRKAARARKQAIEKQDADDMDEGTKIVRERAKEQKEQTTKDQRKQAEERGKRLRDTAEKLGPGNIAQLEAELVNTQIYDRRHLPQKQTEIARRIGAHLRAGGMGQMEAMGRGDQGTAALMQHIQKQTGGKQGAKFDLYNALERIVQMQGQTIGLTNEQGQRINAGIQRNSASLNTSRTQQTIGGP